ncbi:MAG: DUF2855 family protein [Cellvibrionaceae bacterium]|nr:DUF2855 family protein [Cellvibrionaceae bacterium]
MAVSEGKQFWVKRSQLDDTQWREQPQQDLAEGEVRLKVEAYSFTANNITYGAMGDLLQYWQFFPAEGDYGIIPVWGFANIVESNCAELGVGERIYGYFPMAQYLRVRPAGVGDWAFIDASPHRAGLAEVYNQYWRCQNDPLYRPDTEAEQMLLRPLFTTAFLLDDFFAEQDFLGAEQIILSSASSKTAIGTAFGLNNNRVERGAAYKIIGLTSSANRSFVEGLGLYDQVLSYDEIEQLPRKNSLLIDFAGNGDIKHRIHSALAEALQYSCVVGASHWDKVTEAESLPGPEPELFFAPHQAQKRVKELGAAEFGRRLATAWEQFIGASGSWLEVETIYGERDISASYQAVLAGRLNPKQGLIYQGV